MGQRFLVGIVAGCVCAVATPSVRAAENTDHVGERIERMQGSARNKEGEVVFVEKHELHFEGDKLRSAQTQYFDPTGKLIADLSSQYADEPRLPDTRFRDLRSGAEDGARVVGDHIELFRRKGADRELETESLPIEGEMVVGQGFNQLISRSLASLSNDEMIKVKFLLPIRLREYSFRVKLLEADPEKLTVRFESSNWLLRLLVPGIRITYQRATGRILKYEGISNIEDARGRNQTVSIDYAYSTN